MYPCWVDSTFYVQVRGDIAPMSSLFALLPTVATAILAIMACGSRSAEESSYGGQSAVPLDQYAEAVGAVYCEKEARCGDGSYPFDECMRGMEGTERIFSDGVLDQGATYDGHCAADWIDRIQAATCDEWDSFTGPLDCHATCDPIYGELPLGAPCGEASVACEQGTICWFSETCEQRCPDNTVTPRVFSASMFGRTNGAALLQRCASAGVTNVR